ncbi:unnamed protein product [Linum tenue]|uniref:Uncharacterized protein n=1 Tax=Linum tenue TaxID=586396 RepID=A0AAV0KAS4_9ROSI|nr:unnamed protein product [Linum tenue]
MKARLVVFPLRGRNWCFSRSLDPSLNQHSSSSGSPSTFRDLWRSISSSGSSAPRNAQLIVDFIANKMNGAWIGMEKSPDGTLKKKIHGVGLKLLARVKPSEIFLKSISRDVTGVEIVYPVSLNARFVRRRLRHIAVRGASIHKKYFYGSITLLPMTSALSVRFTSAQYPILLGLIPNLFPLASSAGLEVRHSLSWCPIAHGLKNVRFKMVDKVKLRRAMTAPRTNPLVRKVLRGLVTCVLVSLRTSKVLQPSKELEEIIIRQQEDDDDVSEAAIASVCEMYGLDAKDVLKFKDNML